MKRWAILTIGLYFLCISVLTVPLLLTISDWDDGMLLYYYSWHIPILLLVQGVLLLVPIAIVRKRPIPKRKVVVSAVIGAVPMAVMVLGFLSFIPIMIWGEAAAGEYAFGWYALILPALSWPVWGMIFYKSFSSRDPGAFTSTTTRWLLRGSILELLIAIPSHILSRHRDECCAPPITLIGIATGLAIAVMSFGPGVFFLFARKIRDKKRE